MKRIRGGDRQDGERRRVVLASAAAIACLGVLVGCPGSGTIAMEWNDGPDWVRSIPGGVAGIPRFAVPEGGRLSVSTRADGTEAARIVNADGSLVARALSQDGVLRSTEFRLDDGTLFSISFD